MKLAIDPGISTGWALFYDNGALQSCGCSSLATYPRDIRVIIECPQVYPRSKVDPNNLITLAVRVGRYAEHFERLGIPVSLVLPHTWKGSTNKVVNCNRILAALTEPEAKVYMKSASILSEKVKLDVIDAIGLGKWAFANGRWP